MAEPLIVHFASRGQIEGLKRVFAVPVHPAGEQLTWRWPSWIDVMLEHSYTDGALQAMRRSAAQRGT